MKIQTRIVLFFSLIALLGGTPVMAQYQDVTFKPIEFVAPKTKTEWTARQKSIRKTIRELFGRIPAIPQNLAVKIISTEKKEGYTLEKFEFFNGVDATVPGIILIPNGLKGKAPAVLYHHYHGGDYAHGKDELFKKNDLVQFNAAEDLVKAGYVVLAIDAYAFGERSGKGPNGPKEKGGSEELTWAKINLWKGRSFWGMMVRDDQMALNYLCSRPEVDASRIAAVGMSMGCLRSFWLAAVDDRVKVTAAVACLVRNQELIKLGRMGSHGIYYYVHDLLSHFDNESILACIAPRALLTIAGENDKLAPLDGVKYINQSLSDVYKLVGASERFKSLIYPEKVHEYTAEMWQETLAFFKKHL
ncbi:MAG: alpha/beta hydrolase family protein [Spirosomataceae bacterium]